MQRVVCWSNSRKLSTRISKQPIAITRTNHTDYRLGFNHEFNWENFQIFDKERFFNKCLNSKMLHIYMQKNGLNLKTNIEYLHYSY